MGLTVRALALLTAIGAVGCGGTPLTCEIIADPENCWAATAAEIAACLPPNTEIGEFAADRTRCTYGDGTEVVFDEALPDSTFDLERFGFTVNTGGAFCARVVDTFENRIEIESANRSAVAQLRRDFELICGGGPTYESDFDLLFECAGQGAPPPTDGFDVTPDEVFFQISSVTTPGDLFRCRLPAP